MRQSRLLLFLIKLSFFIVKICISSGLHLILKICRNTLQSLIIFYFYFLRDCHKALSSMLGPSVLCQESVRSCTRTASESNQRCGKKVWIDPSLLQCWATVDKEGINQGRGVSCSSKIPQRNLETPHLPPTQLLSLAWITARGWTLHAPQVFVIILIWIDINCC